jgi:Trk-type K+ transport system membrane component
MLIGRVGPLTVVIAMSESKHVSNYHYPEEKVMVG